MKKIVIYLFVCIMLIAVNANANKKEISHNIETNLDSEIKNFQKELDLAREKRKKQQLTTYPSPMSEKEKKDICLLIMNGDYEMVPSTTFEQAFVNEEQFRNSLKKSNSSYTEFMYGDDEVITVVDYNNDGITEKLVRVVYDKSGGNGPVYTYYIVLNGKLSTIIERDKSFPWFHWEPSIKDEKMYDIFWRGGGQRIIKVKGKNYLATLDRDPYFDKLNMVYPNYKFERKIKRVDLIKTYPDGKNINHIVCEF